MKKNSFSPLSARAALSTLFLVSGVLLAALAFSNVSARGPARRFSAPNPTLAVPQSFNGTYDPTVFPCATPRHVFTVPPGQVRIIVNVAATLQTNDLTLTLLFGSGSNPTPLHTEDTGVGTEAYNYQPGGGVPPGVYQVQICESPSPAGPSMAPFTYNGTFTYDNTAPGGNPPHYGPLPTPPPDSGPKVGYENFEAPGDTTPVIVTSSGGATIEYLGRGAGEPSIGANWNTGVINFQSDLETLFITFDDSCNLSGPPGSIIPKASWVNRRAPSSVAVDSDPIGFTDRQTGRVFAGELTLLSPDTCKISFTDSDGLPTMTSPTGWTFDPQAQGPASAVDHETIGGGPYHAPIPPPPAGTIYPNAVYYCSQDIGAAFCTRSDNGGLTLAGTQVPLYTAAQCGGLHGHVKVSPADGTVYVPNRNCGGTQSVVVSQDNGLTWTIHPVDTGTNTAAPSIVGGGDDPAVAVDGGGRVYFAFSNFGGGPGVGMGVAISDDFGNTWKNMFDVGASYGLKNVCFPAAVAGDAGRAAIAFYGSTAPQGPTTGNSNTANFTGVWHLYVAQTFDGGKTWTTTDATPNMPMQRSGLLRGGGADIVRNLLDFFDVTIDRDGRVLVGYVNGCSGGNCAQAPIAADGTSTVHGNTYSATATIARQSSGRRMLAGKDPVSSTSVPGMPFVTQVRSGNVVRLMWSEADNGNSMINNYQIFRGIKSGAEDVTAIATVPGTPGNQTGGSYTDTTATDPNTAYYYRVVAVNSIGSSCANNEIAAPFVGDTCTGLIIHRNDPAHPESTGGGSAGQPPTPQLLIDYIAVGEPPSSPGNLMFKMKVGNLSGTLPPNSRWRIAWDWFNPATNDQMYYVGMTSDAQSNVTFEYGTLADAGVPAVLVLGETKIANIAQSPTGTHFDPDGTITMFVPKSGTLGVGNPHPGDLLGAIGGKTITGDTPSTNTFERSTAFVDHTFIKGQADNAYPPATYTLVGNVSCPSGTIVPIGAVSRKTHGNAGDFDIDLPLIGKPGIECRRNGATTGIHKMVITFLAPVTVNGHTNPIPADGSVTGTGSISGITINGSTVTVDLTGVANEQTITVNLTNVNDGAHNGNVSIPMSVLLGDVNQDGFVLSGDYTAVRQNSGNQVNNSTFKFDVNSDGAILSGDYTIVRQQSGTQLP